MIAPLPKPLAAFYRTDWDKPDAREPIAVIALQDGEKDCIAIDRNGAMIDVSAAAIEFVDGDIRDAIYRAEWADGS